MQRARHDNHFTGNVVDIEFSDSTVTATVNHPFWVMSGGSLNERPAPDQLEEHESEGLSLDGRWLQSQDLRVGDVVFCRDGETREVMSMAIREADSLPISNLSIREWPNYAVGVGGVLVHNRGLCETDIDELAQVIAAHAPDERPVLIKELADDNVASADLDQIRSKVDELTPRRVFASLDELAQTGRIDPSEIRFSQDSISGTFKNGDSVADLAAKLKNGTVDPSSIPAIRLVERNGKIFTLDNRRLKAFQEAGIEIPYQLLEKIPKREMFKFTTINDGIDIIIRGQ